MSVEIMYDSEEIKYCTSCSAPLNITKSIQLYAFDEQYEICDDIKSGKINYSPCPLCGDKWFWPGLLVVDKKKKRGVFVNLVTYNDKANETLSKAFQGLNNLVDLDISKEVFSKTVRVNHYTYIYELICMNDSHFEYEVKANQAFLERIKIDSLSDWADQWLKDGIRTGYMILTNEETNYRRLEAIILAIDKELETSSDNLEFIASLNEIKEKFISLKIEYEDKNNLEEVLCDSQHDGEHQIDLWDKALKYKVELQVNYRLKRRLLDALEKSINDLNTNEYLNSLQLFSVISECLILLKENTYTKSRPRNKSISSIDLEIIIENAVRYAPDSILIYGEKLITFKDALSQISNMPSEIIGSLCREALTNTNQERELNFRIAITKLFVILDSLSPSLVYRFSAYILCASYFDHHGIDDLALGAYAGGLLAVEQFGDIRILPLDLSEFLGVAWQRVSRIFAYSEEMDFSIESTVISAKIFKSINHQLGYFRSRLNSLRYTINYGDREGKYIELERLLQEIRQVKTEDTESLNTSILIDVEIECLCIMADLLYSVLAKYQPRTIISIVCLPYDKVLFLDPDAVSKEQFPELDKIIRGEPVDIASMEIIESKKNEDKEPRNSDYLGSILIARISSKQRVYTESISVNDIPWFDLWNEALILAKENKIKERWFNIQFHLLEKTSRFIQKNVCVYHYIKMCTEASVLGFGDPPELITDMLIMFLARDIDNIYPQFKEELLSLSSIDVALNRIKDKYIQCDSVSSLEEVGLNPISGLLFGEILESLERYHDASDVYLKTVYFVERAFKYSFREEGQEELYEHRAVGLYRSARAMLKLYKKDPKAVKLSQILNVLEALRSRSTLNRPYTQQKYDDNSNSLDERNFTLLKSISFDELSEVFLDSTAILIFSLLEETEANSGFWFSALIIPHSKEVLSLRLISFDDIYNPYLELQGAFEKARKSIVRMKPLESCQYLKENHLKIDLVLEKLGSILVQEEVVRKIEEKNIERLLIIPESYLFDVPYPALIVNSSCGKQHLFQVNTQLNISIAPSLTYFMEDDCTPSPLYDLVHRISTTFIRSVNYRTDLMPIYGVKNLLNSIVENYINKFSSRVSQDISLPPLGQSVADFLQFLHRSSISIFFGHGDINEEQGPVIFASDGCIGEYEINSAANISTFSTRLVVLCACSGIANQIDISKRSRNMSGVHISLLRGGVECVIGCLQPMFYPVALLMLEIFLDSLVNGESVESALTYTYLKLSNHNLYSSPIFWGDILCFGNGLILSSEGE